MNRFPKTLPALVLLLSTAAAAQTGVSDDRVSLPEGPGSLEGVGDNPEVDPNMGAMSHTVAIESPGGFGGLTPDLSLSYNSSASSSEVGMGWKLEGLHYIERMTYRGLPRYTLDDDFCADSEQLVRLPGTDTFRARFEKSFVRYTWHNAGDVGDDGAEGYFTGEYPDGRVAYFGADATGAIVANARVSGPDGTFRYHLVEVVDVFDHKITYQYQKLDSTAPSYIQRIAWVFTNAPGGRYSMTFTYEARESALTGAASYLSDAQAGFDVLTTQRLSGIFVFSGADQIRRYELEYETYEDAGGFTRLSRVSRIGFGDEVYPIEQSFTYSRALGGVCPEGGDCDRPFMVDMGDAPNVGTGFSTLIDINGDALPDLLDTSDNVHVFYLNEMTAAGTQAFDTVGVNSAVAPSGFDLTSQFIQMIDVDGDGFTDLLDTANQQFLKNDGSAGGQVDWMALEAVNAAALPGAFDVGDDGTGAFRFIDFDNDKRIDAVRANTSGTTYYRNGENGYELFDDGVMPLDIDFGAAREELTDMNGDGLLDLVQLFNDGHLEYRLNYGWGRWGAWKDISGLSALLDDTTINIVSLEDLNGDGLSDLILVETGAVHYALNRNGDDFLGVTTLDSDDVDQGSIPDRAGDTNVLYADMNGNGSVDVLWIQANGDADYLELFPVRPNLLATIENGLGARTEVTFGTSVQHMVRDGGAFSWPNRLPHPMLVVDRIDHTDALTNLHEVTEYRYHDGYYDGINKQFRGYANVEQTMLGDATQEEGLTISEFDVGDGPTPDTPDPYRNGLLLRSRVYSGGRDLNESTTQYEDCPLEGIPSPQALIDAGELPIRYVCATATEQTVKEGLGSGEWITLESTMAYDGYGNVILSSSEGVTSMGGGGCPACDRPDEVFGAPCGAQCLGDESYSETEYVDPSDTGGRWILSAPYRSVSYGRAGGLQTESLTYYDGEAFEGLALGQLTEGLVTRATVKVRDGASDVITTTRNRYDIHGNVVETIDPNGSAGDDTTHRRLYVYDDEQLRVVQTDLLLEDASGAPYALRRETQYEDLWDKPVSSSAWILVEGGAEVSDPRDTFFAYDNFGRLVALAKPGDSLATPTLEVEYDLGDPVSRIISRTRSQSGAAQPDIESVRCVDGRGRAYQTRTKLAPGSYQVSGYTVFNLRSNSVRSYQPYLGASGACDLVEPTGVRFSERRYDAIYRALETVAADDGIYGSASVSSTVYGPLFIESYDSNDNDSSSPFANTPLVTRTDGMGRPTSYVRGATGDLEATYTLEYDELGRLHRVIDPGGNMKIQEYDLLGRVTRVFDPNTTGETTFAYDDASNLTLKIDDRGKGTAHAYDGQNRKVATWDDDDEDATRIAWTWDRPDACGATTCTNTAGVLAEVSYPLRDLAGGPGTGFDFVGYDVRGRTKYSAHAIGGVRFETTRSYDNADRLVGVEHPGGVDIPRAYDDAGRVTAIGGFITDVVYDERGQIASMESGDSTSTTRTYDDIMRLASLSTVNAGGQALQGFEYGRDRVGNLLTIEDLADRFDGLSAEASYAYDDWYRVTEATLGAETVSMDFDLLDNLTDKTSSDTSSAGHVGSYSYGAQPNAATAAGDRTFGYDASGNVTDLDGVDLEWDYMNRLVSAPGGATFEYGAGPGRVRKSEGAYDTLYVSPDVELRDGQASVYVRMGKQRIARVHSGALAPLVLSDTAPVGSPDGEVHASDAWASWADGAGIVSAGSGADPAKLLRSAARRMLAEVEGETAYLHGDHLGSITLAVDSDGEVLGQRSYHSFGARRGESGFVDEHGFTGQERDESTGLTAFLYRYLDTASGRWVSVDPAFEVLSGGSVPRFGESTTGYAYVAGMVANATDPTGLFIKRMMQGRRSYRSKVRALKLMKELQHADAKAHLGRQQQREAHTASQATGNALPDFVYRSDGRQLSQIQAAGGFKARNDKGSLTLKQWVEKGAILKNESQWVSTGKDHHVFHDDMRILGNSTAIYKVSTVGLTGHDVATYYKTLGEPNSQFAAQKEVAFDQEIPMRNIVGVLPIGEFMKNKYASFHDVGGGN